MFKRLMLSVVTIGVVAGALAYGAYAFFFDGASSAVSVTAGAAVDLKFDIDQNCTGTPTVLGQDLLPPVTVTGLYPGDSQSACVVVHNTSTTDLDVYARNDTIVTTPGSFAAVLSGKVDNLTAATTPCGFAGIATPQYTTANSNRGCFLFNLAGGASATIKATIKFVDDNTDQNALAGATGTWNSSITGYTTP